MRVTNTGHADVKLEMAAELPDFWEDRTEHKKLFVAVNESKEYCFEFYPTRRGAYTINNIHIRYASKAGLLTLNSKLPLNFQIEVYPDIKELNQYLLLSQKNRLAQVGIHKNRYQGMGTELGYLREYRMDDDAANIDWKVSTRINKPVTKVFQLESTSHVTIVLDCGRLMTGEQQGLSTLDHAINASLILAHIICKTGDQLGMFAFADHILSELPPVKGKDVLKRITGFVSPLQPTFTESNYRLIFELLHRRLKKRSLIIFFTDMMDDINYPLFQKYLGLLNRKHLTLFILLRDHRLELCVQKEGELLSDIFTTAAAREMYMQRSDAVSRLKLHGINVLDLLPEMVTPGLIDKFLELKSRNLF